MWDNTELAAALSEVRADNATSITIRRGATTLAAQSVRIAQAGRQAAREATGELEAAMLEMTILGATNLDIALADRFTVSGLLYEVMAIAPNKAAGVRARARVVE